MCKCRNENLVVAQVEKNKDFPPQIPQIFADFFSGNL